MNKLEKKENLENNQEKSIHPEAYISGVYNGKIDERDEMFKKILSLLKKRCNDNDINYNNDINQKANIIFKTILEKVKEDNNVNISFDNIENFEDELIENINRLSELPYDKRIVMIDSMINMDFLHNSTTSIMNLIREYIASKLITLNDDINQIIYFEEQEEILKNNVFDPFADSVEAVPIDEETKKFYKAELEFFLMLPKFSKLFEIKQKYINQILEMRNEFLIEEEKIKNPQYIEQLQNLTNLANRQNISYYYHGAPSQNIAQKIMTEGLYMQYNDINRTAKKELSSDEILNYSYGHDNVGRHAIVIIAVPKDVNPVNINSNNNITICGTGQGLAQFDFNPQYIIPSEYIVGYIDKDAKQLIANPNYSPDLSTTSRRRV